MDEKKNSLSKYQSRAYFMLLWFIIWYFMGSLYVFISALPSVSIWSIQESITMEGNFIMGSYNIESGSIVNALFLSILWPIVLVSLFAFGWLLAGEYVGYEYNPHSPLIILIYYIKLTQYYLPIFVIGFISGLIALILVKVQKPPQLLIILS